MKLLTPKQAGDAKALELHRDLLRTQEMETATERARINLSNANADFHKALADNIKVWADEEGKHATRVTEMTQEVTELEKRKELALEPIHLKEKEADELLATAKNLMVAVKEKEESNQEVAEILQDRLDHVGERENDLLSQESNNRVIQQSIALQLEDIKHKNTNLSEAIANFVDEKVAWMTQCNKKTEVLTLKEISLNAKEDALQEKAFELDTREAQLKDREEILARNVKRAEGIPL